MTGLWDVVAAGRLRETASLLQRGGEQDAKRELHRMDMNGDNLLTLAVRSSNPDLVQLLLDNGSQPDMRSRKTGRGALHEAVRLPPGIDAMRILDLLVERGAYVNLRDKAGQTPLHMATEVAFEDAIDYLLSVGGNPTLKDKKGRKPVGIAKANTDSHIYETFFNLDFKKHQERKQKGKRKGGVRKKKDPNQRVFKAILLNRLKDLENTLKVGEKGGVRVNSTSHRGHSPLYLASKLGHLEALKLLIKYGAKPYIMNTSGTTALHAAAEGGHDAVVEVLLEHGAPIDVRDNDKKTPLDLAFQKGKGSTTRLLLNLILSRGQTFSQKRWDWMFRKAAKSGQVDLMQLVMKCSKSLNVNTQTLTGWTPLHIAVRNGQVDAVAFLLSQRGIKTNLGTEANWTPLHVACEYSNADRKMKLMSLLLSQKGTNPNIQNTAGFTPLHMCAKKHDLEGVRLLLEYNANPDVKDNKGWTPLSIAYSEKQQKAKLISDAEGKVEVESEQMDDEEEVMHCLIEAGADPNQLSFTSRTSPLFEACRVGMERRAEVLIEHGADVNFVMPARKVKRQKRVDTSRDDADAADVKPLPEESTEEMSQAWSVLSLSVLKERSPRIISLLVQKGADVNFTNAKGFTPLHTAVTLANYEVVKILLEAGADPNICNADGTSPLATAFCVAFADKAEVSTVSVAQEGLGQGPAASATRRYQAEKIIEELFRRGARAEAGSGQSYLKLLKTALYGNSTAILASLLAPRADAGDAPLVAMEALVSDSSELLNYLLNMRRRKNTQLGHLKQLLALFIDGRQCGAEHEDSGVGANLTIACRLDVNMTRAGRTPVHDLVLASVFAVANASKADGALPQASLAFERELIDFLVAKGAQINQPDQNTGFTPLVSAVLALSLLKGNTDFRYRDEVLSLIDHLLSIGAVPSLTIVDKRERTWLHHAAQASDAHNLEKLLALAAKYVGAAGVQGLISAPDSKGRSALHLALIAGHLPTVTCLLQHGADASACDGKGWSSLQMTYMNKDSTEEQLWSIMTELVAHGADVNYRTGKRTILDLAVGNGRWALAEKLSAMGATLSHGSALLGQKNSRQRWPLLHSVAKGGNCEIAKQILDANSVDINDMDSHMWTAVHIAVLHGDVNMTRLLLEHGADLSQNTNHAWSVLHTAAALRRTKTTEEFARQKLDKQKRDQRDFKREERRKAAEAKNAKNAKADGAVAQPERRPRVSREEFEEAKRKRKEEKAQHAEEDFKAESDAQTNEERSEQLLRVLLDGPGAKTLNINGKDERGRTALDVALLVGNIRGGKLLAAHGGRTHKFGFPNAKGWNDLHRAVFEGELRTVRDILHVLSEPAFSQIIDVNAEDMAGLTPLLIAAMKPNARVVKELLEHGADPAHTDRAGRNCLHHALLRKRRAVVKVIMKYVDDDVVMAKTKDGYTCLDLASTQAFKKMSLHDLVSRNYKKAAVEERPENRHDDREKKVKQGRESIVTHDVAAWGGRKTGKAVTLDLFEDWQEWQDDYTREQEEYEAEEEGGRNYRDQPIRHSIDWSEYLPQPVYPYPLHLPVGPPGDQVQYGDYPTLYDPSFTYPPGYADDDAEATTEVAQWTDGVEEHGWTGGGAADWTTWGLPDDHEPRIAADGAEWGEAAADGDAFNPWGEQTEQDPNALPSVCPFCGSLWADSESLTAHALDSHNAHLG